MKPWTEARNNKCMKYHSKLTYQLSFWNVSRKVDYHAGGKWFIHGPKLRETRQKRRKSTFWIQKWSESTLDISDLPETYVENSWGP